MTRREDDAYLTSPELARAICDRLAALIPAPRTILEPSAGEGAFSHAAAKTWPGAYICSVEPRMAAIVKVNSGVLAPTTLEDFFKRTAQEQPERVGRDGRLYRYDLVLGNPPYLKAEQHLALSRAMGYHVAFLLRMSFLSSQGRVERLWNQQHGLRWLIPLAQRPCFTGDGKTDNSEYAVYVFRLGHTQNPEILPHLWV